MKPVILLSTYPQNNGFLSESNFIIRSQTKLLIISLYQYDFCRARAQRSGARNRNRCFRIIEPPRTLETFQNDYDYDYAHEHDKTSPYPHCPEGAIFSGRSPGKKLDPTYR